MSWLQTNRLVALAALAALGACAEERAPIDRVQPNVVDKELLQGEWHYGQTVVWIPATKMSTFVGENTWQGLERVRWDVQERWLFARRAYEKLADGELSLPVDNTIDGQPYMGAIIAAYRIESHFDIRRAYNPTTGEEYNVIEENAYDRPWYQRQYMRVDWSKNHATNFDFLVDDVAQDPVGYYIQDENDPDAPVFEPGLYDLDSNMVENPYLDVTNMVMVQPTMTETEYGTYPSCWFFENELMDCTAQNIKVRHSFRRIDPQHEYAPTKMVGPKTDHFGIFRQERLVVDPVQGVRQTDRIAYSQIHNLWKDWYDDNGNLIPESQREVRPMVYYAIGWREMNYTTVKSVEQKWDTIFREVVAAAKGVPTWDEQVFYICWTTKDPETGEYLGVAEGEPDICGGTGFRPRIGDLRYSTVNHVENFYDGWRLLGFGPSNTDPLTGEVISANAYTYYWNDNVIQGTIEQIQLLNGDMDEGDYIDAVDLGPWAEKTRTDMRQQRLVPQEKIQRYADSMDFSYTDKVGLRWTDEQRAHLQQGVPARKLLPQMLGQAYERGLFNGDRSDAEARLASLQGTWVEKMLITNEVKLAAGIDPATPINSFTEEMYRDASAARVGPAKVQAALAKKKLDLILERNLDIMIGPDDGYFGMAQKYKGKTQAEMWPDFSDTVYHAVLSHELGHTFSLHHNFAGTEDAVNYFDDYWTLREADGTVLPRFQDPPTEVELANEIYRYAYSSIMDYSRLGSDYEPGKYDRAAVIFAYADKVEAWLDTGSVPGGIVSDWTNSDGGVLLFYSDRPRSYHYTNWYRDMGPLMWDSRNRVLVDAYDAEGNDTVDWEDTQQVIDPVKGDMFARVPYVYCTPYQSDIGNSCFTRDYGADEYERMAQHIQIANTWYILRAFTRYKVGVTIEGYVGGTYERYYERLKNFNNWYALLGGILYTYYPRDAVNEFMADPEEGWGAYTLAMADAFNFFMTTMLQPNVATHSGTPTLDAAGEPILAEAIFYGTNDIELDVSNARYFATSWYPSDYSDKCGMYFWQCLHHFGFFLDKMMAIEAMTDASTYFVGRDSSEDIRQYAISFYDDFAPQLRKYMGDILAMDYSEYAPRWQESTGQLVFRDFVDMAAPSPEGTPLQPAAGFTVQLWTAVLGMARLQNNFDKSFLHSSRMWLRGSAFGIDNEFGTIEYSDPLTGLVYCAVNYPDGSGVAQKMIDRANRVLARSHYCTTDCVVGLTEDEMNTADGEIVLYGQNLDVMVDLTGFYDLASQEYGDWHPQG